MGDCLEIGAAARQWEPLVAFLDEEDREGIVNVLEVGPFVDPLVGVRTLWEFARKAKTINLFWTASVSVCEQAEE